MTTFDLVQFYIQGVLVAIPIVLLIGYLFNKK